MIDSLKINIGGRESYGIVQEKSKAIATYSDAIKEKKTACILEKYEDIYSITVGNVDSGQFLEITYTYITRLTNNNGTYKFVLPNNIAERYGAQLNNFNYSTKLKRGPPLVNKTDRNTLISIKLKSQQKISKVYSLTNTLIEDKINENEINVLTVTFPEKGDFNLFMETSNLPVLYYYSDNEKTIGMISHKIDSEKINADNLNNIKKEYLFILDRSGSMQGNKIFDAKNALSETLELINDNSYFNIISFGNDHSAMFHKSIRCDTNNKNIAKFLLEKYNADMGGTEIYNCLEACKNCKFKKYEIDNLPNDMTINYNLVETNEIEKIFIFLTDGDINNKSEVFELAKNLNCRIFTIGIGKDASRDLVEKLALLTHAKSKMIIDSKSIKNEMIDIINTVNIKHYVNLSGIINGNSIEVIGQKTIYPGQVVTLLFNSNETNLHELSITGFNKNEQKQWNLISNENDKKISMPSDLLEKLYTNQLIKEGSLTNDEIIKLSVKYNIMNSLTSFVVVDNVINDIDLNSTLHIEVPQAQTNCGFATSYVPPTGYKVFEPAIECVDALEGGMDMFGGGGSYVTKCNYFIINHKQKDGSFDMNDNSIRCVVDSNLTLEYFKNDINKNLNELDFNVVFNIIVLLHLQMMRNATPIPKNLEIEINNLMDI